MILQKQFIENSPNTMTKLPTLRSRLQEANTIQRERRHLFTFEIENIADKDSNYCPHAQRRTHLCTMCVYQRASTNAPILGVDSVGVPFDNRKARGEQCRCAIGNGSIILIQKPMLSQHDLTSSKTPNLRKYLPKYTDIVPSF